jgi:hypothetical protein
MILVLFVEKLLLTMMMVNSLRENDASVGLKCTSTCNFSLTSTKKLTAPPWDDIGLLLLSVIFPPKWLREQAQCHHMTGQ